MSIHKTRAHLWLLALAAGGLTLAHDALDKTAQAAAPSHTLFCRGGGVQKLYVSLGRASFRGDVGLGVTSEYWLTKSKKRYSPDTLGVGECAWTDRPLNTKEPTKLYKKGRTEKDGFGMTIALGPKGGSVTPPTSSSVGWRYFGALNQSDKIVELSARMKSKQLTVTRVRAIHKAPGNHVKRR